MNGATLVTFLTFNFVADIAPGPAVMFVLAASLKYGVRRAIAAILGILSANAFYFAVSATAMGAILAASNLFAYIKWLGAAYLVYMGVRAILTAPSIADQPRPTSHIYRDAVFTQLSNPKTIVYFSAIVPRFVDPSQPIPQQMLLLGVLSVVMEFFVLLAYAAAASQGLRFARDPRYAAWTNRVSGAMFIAVALALVLF